MQCRRCGFPLWNVRGQDDAPPRCPECGARSRPSEYALPPGSVHYGCVHCDARYVGTSPTGHLVPPTFACTGCGAPCSMDEMVVTPAPGVDPAGLGNAWLDRSGVTRGFVAGLRSILLAPVRFAQSLPYQAAESEALRFLGIGAALATVSVALSQACWFGAMIAVVSLTAPKGQTAPLTAILGWNGVGGMMVVLLPFGLVLGFLAILVESAVAHAIVRGGSFATVPGARPRDDDDAVPLRHARQLYLYFFGASSALTCLLVIPCVGSVLGAAWIILSFVVLTLLLRTAYRSTTTRAVVAVIVGRVITGTAMAVLVAGTFIWAPQLLGLPRGLGARLLRPAPANPLASRLMAQRTANGAWPATPIDVVIGDTSLAFDLLSMTQGGDPNQTIGRMGFAQVWSGDWPTIQAESTALAARIPPGQAFRLGRAIFVYPLSAGGPQDWLLMVEPQSAGAPWIIETADRKIVVPSATFAAELAAENQRRATSGLSPIPDPSTLTDLAGSSHPNAGPVAP